MSAGWKVFWLAVAICAIALVAQKIVVPDVVPIGYAREPQASWAVLTAFVLRAVELTTGWVAVIALGVMSAMRLRNWLRRSEA